MEGNGNVGVEARVDKFPDCDEVGDPCRSDFDVYFTAWQILFIPEKRTTTLAQPFDLVMQLFVSSVF